MEAICRSWEQNGIRVRCRILPPPSDVPQSAFYTALTERYTAYCASLTGLRGFSGDIVCLLTLHAARHASLYSVWEDVAEWRGASLTLWRRETQCWLLPGEHLLSPRRLLTLCGCKHPLRKRFDGYILRDGALVGCRNRFTPGMEQGLRRSEYRQFIEETPLAALPEA